MSKSRCGVKGCGEPAKVRFLSKWYCLSHYVEKANEMAAELKEKGRSLEAEQEARKARYEAEIAAQNEVETAAQNEAENRLASPRAPTLAEWAAQVEVESKARYEAEWAAQNEAEIAVRYEPATDYGASVSSSRSVSCPTCGSNNVRKQSNTKRVGKVAAFGLLSVGSISKTFKCKGCGYTW